MQSNNKKSKSNKVFDYFLSEKFKPTSLSKYFWIFGLLVIFIGTVMLCSIGFNLGMDFTGGNIITVKSGEDTYDDAKYNQIQSEITKVFNENGLSVSRLQKSGTGSTAEIQIQYQNINADMEQINEKLKTDLETIFSDEGYVVSASQTKSASASSELLLNSLIALSIAIIAILIYTAIRFELVSGLSAIITLAHDVLVMTALVIICRIEINASFIAALITILGYSVNNTIVVFDRVRENCKKESLAGLSNSQIADLSVRQTLTRTLGTSITTIAAVFMLAIIGVDSIREFIIPILFGLIVGTYAAIFISAPLWTKMITNSRFDKRSSYYISKKKKTKKDLEPVNFVETTAEPHVD